MMKNIKAIFTLNAIFILLALSSPARADNDCEKSLKAAMSRSSYEAVERILKRNDCHVKAYKLFSSLKYFDKRMVKLLSKYGIEFDGDVDAAHQHHFLNQIIQGKVYEVEALIKAGANVNYVYATSWTPLMYAAYHDKVDVMALLIKNGADMGYRSAAKNPPFNRRTVLGAMGGIFSTCFVIDYFIRPYVIAILILTAVLGIVSKSEKSYGILAAKLREKTAIIVLNIFVLWVLMLVFASRAFRYSFFVFAFLLIFKKWLIPEKLFHHMVKLINDILRLFFTKDLDDLKKYFKGGNIHREDV